jgi:hypothetical protein
MCRERTLRVESRWIEVECFNLSAAGEDVERGDFESVRSGAWLVESF